MKNFKDIFDLFGIKPEKKQDKNNSSFNDAEKALQDLSIEDETDDLAAYVQKRRTEIQKEKEFEREENQMKDAYEYLKNRNESYNILLTKIIDCPSSLHDNKKILAPAKVLTFIPKLLITPTAKAELARIISQNIGITKRKEIQLIATFLNIGPLDLGPALSK